MSDDEQQQEYEPETEGKPGDEGIRATLGEIGRRIPNYARLSQRLVAAGLMSANQEAQILGPLGYGPLARVTRVVPLLSQVTRVLTMVGAVRFALTQLEPEVADQHLAEVGLTRDVVEADFRFTRDLAKRAGATGSQHASRVLEDGARTAGRLTGKGLRAFRNWQARSSAGSKPVDRTDRS